ncbi:copper-resistance protein, CopA family [Kushneria avicenniae]|uniref:Copper-resistance protein, CopA family n=1 Tax=Kushneria avicenniae TaxID=402385 RepID=A0A1I1JF41_9GAMM|nr:copper resistance system multicopper oxidase [Kushneria avicenniae]SFC44050.1 copper-resistance protein, CopA family [Kushneria avicenniae]
MTHHSMDRERRRLLMALAGTGVLAGLEGLLPGYARGDALSPRAGLIGQVNGGASRSVSLDFNVRREQVAIASGHGAGVTVNHVIPAPLIEFWEGQNASLRVHNHLDEDTSIHWHGLLLPFQMDGVPGVSFPGIAPGTSFEARFPVRQNGTYWYHSHSGMQEQTGLTGPLIIHPAEPPRHRVDREYVIMLNDWTFEDPHRVMARLKSQSDYYNHHERTVGDFFEHVDKKGWAATLRDRLAWNNMRMSPRDIADVTGSTYTYLMNGRHPAVGWEGLFTPGERLRLRVINASAMSYFNFRIPGLVMTVVAADGKEVVPVDIDEFQIGVAETYDVMVEPRDALAFTLMAESMDRSGFAVGTLASRPGLRAEVPPLRQPPRRTMKDMGMAMDMNMEKDMGMGKDMNMSHDSMGDMSHEDMTSHMGRHDDSGGHADSDEHGAASGVVARHNADHHGAGNISVAQVQYDRLDEPGTGLAEVDHRVLVYSQLRNVEAMRDRRPPSRTIELHLTGNMERYMWSFDGREYSQSTPLEFPYGERIRLVLVNDTMMEHPIHLHGMFMELENGQDGHLPFKHTISVLPASRVSLLVTADEPGRWAFHCHLLYHMDAGMFRVVQVRPQEAAHHV